MDEKIERLNGSKAVKKLYFSEVRVFPQKAGSPISEARTDCITRNMPILRKPS